MQGLSTLNETNVCIICRRGSLPIRILCSIPVNNTIYGILYIKNYSHTSMNTTLYQSPIVAFIPTDTQSTYASVHINTDMQTKVVL